MFRRSLPDALIAALAGSRVWANIVADRELSPEVRDGHVTVYYRGGALLQSLRLDGDVLAADVHPKYVPLRPAGPAPVRLVGTPDGLGFADTPVPLPLGSAGPEVVAAYKERMASVLASFPEGEIVQAVVVRPENQVVDQEVAFQAPGGPRDKIDVCHYDVVLGRLAFAEVKRVDDERLVRPAGRPEVLDQLAAYGRRLAALGPEVLAAYRDVVGWKRAIGLGARLSRVPPGGPTELLPRPVLVIGNCSAADVAAIRVGAGEWGPLVVGLPEAAAGLILCGRGGCRLSLAPGAQTLVF